MHRFDAAARSAVMTHAVSYHDVPVPRGVAFALWDCERHGARISLASCIRTDRVIAEHNREFGTNLHGQQWLIDAHARDPRHFSPANPVNRTSHCWFADGNAHYKNGRGQILAPGGQLPWWMVGIDVDDLGHVEDNTHLIAVAHRLGYDVIDPYTLGSERHHLIFTKTPVPVLKHRKVIA